MLARFEVVDLLLALPDVSTWCPRVSPCMMRPDKLIIVWRGSSMSVSALIPLCINDSWVFIDNHIIRVITLLCKNLHIFMMASSILRSIRMLLLLSPGKTPSKLFFIHVLRKVGRLPASMIGVRCLRWRYHQFIVALLHLLLFLVQTGWVCSCWHDLSLFILGI